jgi:hypothetical protein
LSDGADLAATVLVRRALPAKGAGFAAVMAAVSAAITIAGAAALEPSEACLAVRRGIGRSISTG